MPIFSNQATLTYDGNTTNSNTVTGEIRSMHSASKTAMTGTYRPGDSITYIIRIENSGTSPLTSVTVSDNLGAYCHNWSSLTPLTYTENSLIFYVDGIPQSTPAVESGPPLIISDLSIPAKSTALLLYEATVNAYAPANAGDTITNVATISGCNLSTSLEVRETIAASSSVELIISKNLCPSTVTENDTLTYTFVIQNIGISSAGSEDAAVITDTFEPALTSITVLYNGEEWQSPSQYVYDSVNGVFSTVPGQITVPAATFTQEAGTGIYVMTPGVSVLQVTGTVSI